MGVGKFEEDLHKEKADKKKKEQRKKEKPNQRIKVNKKENQTPIYTTCGQESNPEARKEQFGPSEGRNYFDSSVTVTHLHSALFFVIFFSLECMCLIAL